MKNLQYVLSNFEILLALLLLSWLLRWANLLLFSESPAGLRSALVYALCSAIHTLQRATALSSSSSVTKKRPVWHNVVVYAGIRYPARELEHKLTFLSDTTN